MTIFAATVVVTFRVSRTVVVEATVVDVDEPTGVVVDDATVVEVLEVVEDVGVDEIVNEMGEAVADACRPETPIVAPIVQVPAATNVTTPEDAFTVQTGVVELEYVLVPLPSDAVEVMVGGVASPEYVAEYEPALMERVREIASIWNDLALELFAA